MIGLQLGAIDGRHHLEWRCPRQQPRQPTGLVRCQVLGHHIGHTSSAGLTSAGLTSGAGEMG